MAGNSMNDYDLLEQRFHHLKQAKVITADYAKLRDDFSDDLQGVSDSAIDEWLVQQCAWISDGQVPPSPLLPSLPTASRLLTPPPPAVGMPSPVNPPAAWR